MHNTTMDVTRYDADICLMTKFFGLIGGKWKPILLYLIEHDVNRFSQMLPLMPSISRKILTEQLRELEADGLIVREEVRAKAPKVVIYRLTDKGSSLREMLAGMFAWCEKHIDNA